MKTMQLINDQESPNNEVNLQIKATFDLLKSGEEEIQLCDKYRDVILVLGNTGAGKTTFTQWIAGDNDKLIAKEVVEGSGEFIIEDNDRIGNSTIKSKTTFPELVIDSKTDASYYDCPGFSDTRGTSNDISATYFIKRVLDHAKRVKMIFIVNYSSVRTGVDRHDFMKLMRHAMDLIKDVDKFGNSIAVVVTKVDNQYVKKGKSFSFVDDSTVILTIAEFLYKVKQDLGDSLSLLNTSVKKQKFYESSVKFIDKLLVKEQDYYTKIGIFRRPDQPGSLSNITLLQEGKEHIERMLNEKLNFTEKVAEDFGYTISEKSKNDVIDLVEEINKSIWSNINSITKKVQVYYHDLVEEVCNKMKSFLTSGSGVDAQQLEAEIFLNKFSDGNNVISYLAEELTNLTNPEDLADKINSSFTDLEISLFSDNMLGDIANMGKYFNFLQIVSDKILSTRPWADLFVNILPYFSKLKTNVENVVSDTAKKINKHLNNTAETVHKHYYNKMKLFEIQELPAELRKDHDIMFAIVKEIESANTTHDLLRTLQIIYNNLNGLGISLAKNNIPVVVNQKKYFNFLRVISDKELNTETLPWICPFQDAVNYLEVSAKWYTFLNSLFSKFSEYEIQIEKGKYNVANLEDWGTEGTLQGIKINKNNFHEFLNKTAEYNIAEYDNIKNIMVTGLQLEELNHVLNLTLKHRMSLSCIEPFISIKGSYISIKDAATNIISIIKNTDVDVENNCSDILTALKSERFKFIKVFALNTVFIDSSVPNIKSDIVVIAPKWDVIGNLTISLDGNEGKSYYNATVQKNEYFTLNIIHGRSKAMDGTCPGARGADGRTGGAGGPGGFFFGIGEQFINGANLTITANGGVGGSGEDGGNGYNGTYGSSPEVPSGSDQCGHYLCDNGKKIHGFNCKKKYCSTLQLQYNCTYKIFGKPGEKGGGGGNGGKVGKGGNPGNIVLFELNGNSKISKLFDVGKDGQNGKDGIPGVAGDEYYQDITASCKSEWWFGTWYKSWKLMEAISNKGESSRRKCKNNTDVNVKIVEKPKPANIINDLEKAKILNEYKTYVRANLNDRFTKLFLTMFLRNLENNKDIKAVYNTLGLIDELQGLDEQFHELNKGVDLLPFYQSLLDRINEYAHKPKENGDLNQYKRVLSYLYTATLGRIYNLEDNFESNLIVNITLYLSLVQEDINALKELKKAKNKVDLIDKYKQEYKKTIDVKIKEAKDLISKEIMPEIDNIDAEIDDKIELLINEVIAMQEQSKEEQIQLNEKKQQLEAELALQGIFIPFKILGQVLSFLGPVGEIAGSVIEVGSTLTESFASDKVRSTLQLAGSVSDLEVLQGQIKTIKDRRVIHLKKMLEDLSQGIDEYPGQLGNISLKVANIKDKLNKIDENTYNIQEIQILENELKSTLQKQEEELKTKTISNEETKNALLVIGYFEKAVQLNSAMFDTYSKYRNDQAGLAAINDAIDSKEREFQELKEFEEKIYDTIAPMLQKIKNTLDDIASKLDTKSKVALDITNWQIQSTFGDIEFKIEQMVKGLKVEDNLIHCIIKLKDAMTILIDTYNHIQDYQKDQNFTYYVADVSSITASDIDVIVNPELGADLRNAVHELDTKVKSSIVLQRYQVAIDAFKQFVFPFAHTYLKGLVLPSHLELVGANGKNVSFDALLYEATKQIAEINSKLKLYKGLLTQLDGSIGIGDFSSHYVSAEPFFVWKNTQYKKEISKLLSGQEVVLKADIMNSSPEEDAIKFNTIELNFNVKNESAQFEINNVLKGFNISMTHLGNSYYRFNNKIYPITTNSQDFWYHFEKNNNTEPVRRSISYEKLKNADFVLSPYALWKIKLVNVKKNTRNYTFKDLEMYKDNIDLELSGKGYFINKGGVSENLMVERYYKAIDDTHDLLNFNVDDEKSIAPVGHISNRNRRQTNREPNDGKLLTVFNQNNDVDQNNQAYTENENSNTEAGWFSWIKLPSFNFLPVAAAAVVENRKLDQKEYSNLNSISLEAVVLSQITKVADYTTNSNSLDEISNSYADFIVREDNSSSSNNLKISFVDESNPNNIEARSTFDINGTLTLGQLVAYIMFGSNKSLSSNHYISDKQEQYIRIKKLSEEVLPIVHQNSLAKWDLKQFVGNYNNGPQWYQDMYKFELLELVSKKSYRNKKRDTAYQNSCEGIFENSVWMFGE